MSIDPTASGALSRAFTCGGSQEVAPVVATRIETAGGSISFVIPVSRFDPCRCTREIPREPKMRAGGPAEERNRTFVREVFQRISRRSGRRFRDDLRRVKKLAVDDARNR